MLYQIFLSPQVKRWMIITYKHGIYKLPNELQNNLRFKTKDLRKLGNIRKVSKFHRMIAKCQVFLPKIFFVNTCKKLLKNRNLTLPIVRYFTWKLELVSDILWMIVDHQKMAFSHLKGKLTLLEKTSKWN